jgi:hypothetical protein
MDLGTWIGILGIAFGVWQWLENKRKGDVMLGFLHGLKTGKLDNLQLQEVNDMLARLQPPKKAQRLPKKSN